MALLTIQEPIAINKINNSSEIKSDEDSNIVVGIDFGTTNSIIAYINQDQINSSAPNPATNYFVPTFFADETDQNLHASAVLFDKNGEFLAAGNQAVTGCKPQQILIRSIKRLFGKSKNEVSSLNSGLKCLISNPSKVSDDSSNLPLTLQIGQKSYFPAEIAVFIFKELLKSAEKKLAKTPSKAVISVPAYFDEAAKTATKQAARLAGLEVLRLISEPTAAAYAYGLENRSEGQFLVYDLGGGTFDASVLKIQNGVFRVIGVAGNNALGGDDFDQKIAQLGFLNPKQVKEFLSANQKFVEADKSLSRTDFEALIADEINGSISIIRELLSSLNLGPSEIDGVILVGGSTRIPLIKQKLSEIFGEEKILTNLDPDRVVAIGTAWQAFNLSSAKKNDLQKNLLLDVNPLSLGVEMMGGIVEKIILRNSTIPCIKTKEFTTYADNQSAMWLHIVQGEREFAGDCRSLARFEIRGIPPMKAGLARVKVSFILDADGLLTVKAQEKITGKTQEIEIRPSFSLSEDQIREMLIESLSNSQSDIQNRLLAEAIVEINHDLAIIEADLNDENLVILPSDRLLICDQIKKIKELIRVRSARDQLIQAQKYLAKLCEPYILDKVNNILKQKVEGKNINNFV